MAIRIFAVYFVFVFWGNERYLPTVFISCLPLAPSLYYRKLLAIGTEQRKLRFIAQKSAPIVNAWLAWSYNSIGKTILRENSRF